MAMIKLVSPAGWDFDAPAASLLKVSSRGLVGRDYDDLVKRAGAETAHVFAGRLAGLKLAADEVPVHLISHGASDFWGANRNGDGFKSATCREHCHTFEKFARFYRNHQNKDPAKSYGFPKFAAYNAAMHRVELLAILNATKQAAARNGGLPAAREVEKLARGEDLPVSMACPIVGTLVKLRRGWKPVEAIVPGDEVLTHRGRYRPVYATIRRTKQHLARISTEFYGRQVLEFTPEHEFYVARWRDVPPGRTRNGVRANDRTGFSRVFRRKYREQLYAHARWLPCGELQPGDLLLMPIDRGDGSSPLTATEARQLGYYVAEGSLTADGYLCYTCNRQDALIAEAADLFTASHSCAGHSGSAAACNLTVYDKALAATVAGAAGRGVRNKTIPRTVYDAPADIKLEFLSAWLNGDGWQDGKGLHWSTCSRTLSIELQMLLASVGIPASVYRIDHTSDLPKGKPRSGDGTEYTVNISNRYSGMFAGRSKAEVVQMRAVKTTAFITGDYLAIPVAGVELVERAVDVCDLSVEEDESFTAFGLAVHNCRVPHDVCSWCQKQARSRAEYCTGETCAAGGCRDNLARLVKVGGDVHHLHVDNPHPVWFDISHVFRPADQTAYGMRADYLTKAAADGGFFAAGSGLAETLAPPLGVVLFQAGLDAPPELQPLVKLAYGLDALERRAGPAVEDSETLRAFDPALRPPWQPSAAAREKRAAFLTALADCQVVLPLEEYAALVKRAEHAAAAAPRVAGALGGMIADGTLTAALTGAAATLDGAPDGRLRAEAEALAPDRALTKEAVVRRSMRSALRRLPVPRPECEFSKRAAAAPAEAEALARDYAAYRVAALHRIAAHCDDLLLTSKWAQVQTQLLR